MKAARYYGIGDVRCEDIPKPSCGRDEALIKVSYAGICGSDLHIYNKGMFIINIPETMGHEFSGVIEDVGEDVVGFKPGDAVIANPMVPCMECESCKNGSFNTCENLSFIGEIRQGCFAEYISLKADTLIPVPKTADLKSIALSEPLAVALNVCERAKLSPSDSLAVIGAGPIGLLIMLAASSIYGVENITVADLSDTRLKLSEKCGAQYCTASLPDGMKFTKVIDAAGQPATLNTAIAHTQANGTLYVVSIFEKEFHFDINTLVAAQASLVGCNVYTRKNLEDAVKFIAEGKIDVKPLISREFDLSECQDAFSLLCGESKSAAKVLFKM